MPYKVRESLVVVPGIDTTYDTASSYFPSFAVSDTNVLVFGHEATGALPEGFAKVYEVGPTGEWQQLGQTLNFPDPPPTLATGFGSKVGISRDAQRIAVGCPHYPRDGSNLSIGTIFIYDWNGASGEWVLDSSRIIGSAAGDEYGFWTKNISFGAGGNRVVTISMNASQIRAFERGATGWNPIFFGDWGNKVYFNEAGDRIVVLQTPASTTDYGAVIIYEETGPTGNFVEKLRISQENIFTSNRPDKTAFISASTNASGTRIVVDEPFTIKVIDYDPVLNTATITELKPRLPDVHRTYLAISSDGKFIAASPVEPFSFETGKVVVFYLDNDVWVEGLGTVYGHYKNASMGFGRMAIGPGPDYHVYAGEDYRGGRLHTYGGFTGEAEDEPLEPFPERATWTNETLIRFQHETYSIATNASGSRLIAGNNNFSRGEGELKGIAVVYGREEGSTGRYEIIGAPFMGATASDLGSSVAMNAAGNIVAIGAPHYVNTGGGKAYVYRYNEDSKEWSLEHEIFDKTGTARGFGDVVALNTAGDFLAVSEYNRVLFYELGPSGSKESGEVSVLNPLSIKFNETGDRIAIGSKGKISLFFRAYHTWYPFGIWTGSRLGVDVSLNGRGDWVAFPDIELKVVKVFRYAEGRIWEKVGNDISSELRYGDISLNHEGNRLAVGEEAYSGVFGEAGGKVSIYELDGAIWKKIETVLGTFSENLLGLAVSMNYEGSVVLIGSDSSPTPAVQVFSDPNYTPLPGTTAGPTPLAWIPGTVDAGTRPLNQVDTNGSGSRIVVGFVEDWTDDDGRVVVYEGVPGSTFSGYTRIGATLDGEVGANYGYGVAMNTAGTRIAVGGHKYGDGYVDVYDWSGDWMRVVRILGESGTNEAFGTNVSLNSDGTRLAVGSVLYGAGNEGRVQVYEIAGSTAYQIGNNIVGATDPASAPDGTQLGWCVSLNAAGDRVAAGAGLYRYYQGYVQVYYLDGGTSGTWVQVGATLTSDVDRFYGSFGNEWGWGCALNATGNVLVASVANRVFDGEVGAALVYRLPDNNVANDWTLIGDPISGGDIEYQWLNPVTISASGHRIAFSQLYINTLKVYEYTSTGWSQVLNPITGKADDQLSWGIAMNDAGTMVVGGPYNPNSTSDAVQVYFYQSASETPMWIPGSFTEGVLRPLVSADLNSSGTRIIAGFNSDSVGEVVVYESAGAGATAYTRIGATFEGVDVGYDVAMNATGNRIAMSRVLGDGSVDIFDWNDGWSHLLTLSGESGTNEAFGARIAFNAEGDRVAISSLFYSINAGRVSVYKITGDTATRLGHFVAGNAGERFGREVSLNSIGDRLAVCASGGLGYVEVYYLNEDRWLRIGSRLSSPEGGVGYGCSLTATGNRVAITSNNHSFNGATGHALVYDLSGGVSGDWQLVGNPIPGTGLGDSPINSIKVSKEGDRVVFTEDLADTNGLNSGAIFVYEYDSVFGYWARVWNVISGAEADNLSYTVAANDTVTIVAGGPGISNTTSDRLQVFFDPQPPPAPVEWTRGTVSDVEGIRPLESVAMDETGDRFIVGFRKANGSIGASCAYQRIAGTNDYLVLGSTFTADTIGSSIPQCGSDVAMNQTGTRVAIGSPGINVNGEFGFVDVFDFGPSGDWERVVRIVGEPEELFGNAVAFNADGTRLAVTSANYNDGGVFKTRVQVYDIEGATAHKIGQVTGRSTSHHETKYGLDLNGAGNILAFGDSIHDARRGYAAVYHIEQGASGAVFTQIGATFEGQEQQYEGLGVDCALSLSGERFVVADPYELVGGVARGAVRVYDLVGGVTGSWAQVGGVISNDASYDWLYAVDISASGHRVAIGSYRNSGVMRVYEYSDAVGDWVQVWEPIRGGDGTSIGIALNNAGTILVGGPNLWFSTLDAVQVYFDPDAVDPEPEPNPDPGASGEWIPGAVENSGFRPVEALAFNEAGDVLVAGFPWASNKSGNVVVYKCVGGRDYIQTAVFDGDAESELGDIVAINKNGTRIAIGSKGYRIDLGFVKVYDYDGVKWSMSASIGDTGHWDSISLNDAGDRLLASYNGSARLYSLTDTSADLIAGFTSDLENGGIYNVSINALGDRIALYSRYQHPLSEGYTGEVNLYFEDSEGAWHKGSGIIFASEICISLAGDRLVSSGLFAFPPSERRVTVYNLVGGVTGSWEPVGTPFPNSGVSSSFPLAFFNAAAISSSGHRVAITSKDENDFVGVVRVFEFSESVGDWVEVWGHLGGGTGVHSEEISYALALNDAGTIVAFGPYNQNATTDAVQVYFDPGATFDFVPKPIQIGPDFQEPTPNAMVGYDVAMNANGSVAAISIPGGNGEVRVFRSALGLWEQLGPGLTGSPGEEFGHSISLGEIFFGKNIAIGCPGIGAVRAFKYVEQTNKWVQMGSDVVGPSGAGTAVATTIYNGHDRVSRPAIVVGAPGANTVQLYYYSSDSVWTKYHEVTMPGVSDFGRSVSVAFNAFAVGEPGWDGGTGAAHVYMGAIDPVYVFSDVLKFPDEPTYSLYGSANAGRFGQSTSLEFSATRNVIQFAVGCPKANGSGLVEIYTLDLLGIVVPDGRLEGSGTEEFGHSVSMGDDRLVVGSPKFTLGGEVVGAARVFDHLECQGWIKTDEVFGSSGDAFGWAVDSSTLTSVIVGAPDSNLYEDRAGLSRAYMISKPITTKRDRQIGKDLYGKAPFGLVSLSALGDRMAVGSVDHAGDAGEVRLHEYSPETGCWVQIADTIPGGFGGTLSDSSLISLSPDGSSIAVARPSLNTVTIYTLGSSGDWMVRGITAPSGSVRFGTEVCLADGRVGVCSSTHAYVFDVSTGSQLGQDFPPLREVDGSIGRFPIALSRYGDVVAFRIRDGDKHFTEVLVFKYVGGIWEADRQDALFTGQIYWLDSEQQLSYGDSISMSYDGKRVAVGCRADSGGSVYIFSLEGDKWEYEGILSSESGLVFGYDVRLSGNGNTLAIYSKPEAGVNMSGNVRFHHYADGNWKKDDFKIHESGFESMGGLAVNGLGTVVATGLYKSANLPHLETGAVRAFSLDPVVGTWVVDKAFTFREDEFVRGQVSIDDTGDAVAVSLSSANTHSGVARTYNYKYGKWTWELETGVTHHSWNLPNPIALNGNAVARLTTSAIRAATNSEHEVILQRLVGGVWQRTAVPKLMKSVASVVAVSNDGNHLIAISYLNLGNTHFYYHVPSGSITLLPSAVSAKISSDGSKFALFDTEGNLNFYATGSLPELLASHSTGSTQSFAMMDSSLTKISVAKHTRYTVTIKSFVLSDDRLEKRCPDLSSGEFKATPVMSGNGDRLFVSVARRIDIFEFSYVLGAWMKIASTAVSTHNVSTNYAGDRLAFWSVSESGMSRGVYMLSEKPLPIETDPSIVDAGFVTSDNAGFAMDMVGGKLVIGAPGGTGAAGVVKLLETDHTGGSFAVKYGFTGDAGDRVGWSCGVAENGHFVAGAPFADSGTGKVYSFGSPFASGYEPESALTGNAPGDFFGWSVSLPENDAAIAVGAPGASYVRISTADDRYMIYGETGDETGHSVAFSADGKHLVVGSPGYADSRGKASLYRVAWPGATADLIYEFAGASGDRLGTQVSIAKGIDDIENQMLVSAVSPGNNKVISRKLQYDDMGGITGSVQPVANLQYSAGTTIKLDRFGITELSINGTTGTASNYTLQGSAWNIDATFKFQIPEGTLSALDISPDSFTGIPVVAYGGNIFVSNGGQVVAANRNKVSTVDVSSLWEHDDELYTGIHDVAISGNGRRAAVSIGLNSVDIFDVVVGGWAKNESLVLDFGGNLSLNHDGSRIAVGGFSETRVYELTPAVNLLTQFAIPTGGVGPAVVSLNKAGNRLAISFGLESQPGLLGSASPLEIPIPTNPTNVYYETGTGEWAPIGAGIASAKSVDLNDAGDRIIAADDSTYEFSVQIADVKDGAWSVQAIESPWPRYANSSISVAMNSAGDRAVFGHSSLVGFMSLKILKRDSNGVWKIVNAYTNENATGINVGMNSVGDLVHFSFTIPGVNGTKCGMYIHKELAGGEWVQYGTKPLGAYSRVWVRSDATGEVFFSASEPERISAHTIRPQLVNTVRAWKEVHNTGKLYSACLSRDGLTLAYGPMYNARRTYHIETIRLSTAGVYEPFGTQIPYFGKDLPVLNSTGTRMFLSSSTEDVDISVECYDYDAASDAWVANGSFSSTGENNLSYAFFRQEILTIDAKGEVAALLRSISDNQYTNSHASTSVDVFAFVEGQWIKRASLAPSDARDEVSTLLPSQNFIFRAAGLNAEGTLLACVETQNYNGVLERIRVFKFENGVLTEIASKNTNLGYKPTMTKVQCISTGEIIVSHMTNDYAYGSTKHVFVRFLKAYKDVSSIEVEKEFVIPGAGAVIVNETGTLLYSFIGEAVNNQFRVGLYLYDVIGSDLIENHIFVNIRFESGVGEHAIMSAKGDVVFTGRELWSALEIPVFATERIGQTVSGSEGDNLGFSVATDFEGNHMILGGPSNSINGTNAGSARVYSLDGATWRTSGAPLLGDVPEGRAGWSVAMNSTGSRVVVGAPGDETVPGVVRIYDFVPETETWTPTVISSETAGNRFGWSVAIGGENEGVIAVGSPYANDGRGQVNFFVHNASNGAWELVDEVLGDGAVEGSSGANFGWALSFGGISLAIGAPGANSGSGEVSVISVDYGVGFFYAFSRKFSGVFKSSPGANAGWSVAFKRNGDRLVIGYPGEDGGKGKVRAFYVIYNILQLDEISGEPGDERFGSSVSIDFLDTVSATSLNAANIYKRNYAGYESRWSLVKRITPGTASGLSAMAGQILGTLQTVLADGSAMVVADTTTDPSTITVSRLVPAVEAPETPEAPEEVATYTEPRMSLFDFLLYVLLAAIVAALAFCISYPRLRK